MVPSRVDSLIASLPVGARVATDPDVVSAYAADRTHAPGGKAIAVVHARDIADVAATLTWASRYRVPVVPRGAGTGLSGGATAPDGSVVLSLAAMSAIAEIDPVNMLAVVEPGVINGDLNRAARAHGLMFAPDPASFEISTVGGNIATNAGGLRCVKYGVTRDAVLGLEVVLADGRTIRTGRRTVKGVTGYDLTSLFTGSEGTLGVITSATVRLRPLPAEPPATVLAVFPDQRQAAGAAASIVSNRLRPSLLELIDRATLRAIDDWKRTGFGLDAGAVLIAQTDDPPDRGQRISELCRAAGATETAVSSDETEADALLEIRRLAYPATERLGACLPEDVCVPVSRLGDMIGAVEEAGARHGVSILTVAHAGDGNLHPVFVYDRGLPAPPQAVWDAADEIFTRALAMGGTLTGEHGVGLIKRRWLGQELDPESLAVQHAIKRALDPSGILNPGKAI
ncbi:FAD-binding oxidoreductase [Nocardia sp. NPDC051570]|uniref:FAD-binding oxidoreductase n=1 Tax=Nocardia sp. NPDC051570 TaxID=3364324 RepID=UPI0037A691FF